LPVVDQRGRAMHDLRVSVTDRCNFRCRYCMPREHFGKDHAFLPRSQLLSFEEISRVVRTLVPLGVQKVRLTGGEPLLRAELPVLVEMLAGIPNLELTLTTNGSLLAKHAEKLARAGLQRITVSLDSLDPDVFRQMTDAPYGVSDVLEGIAAAAASGFTPLKINVVVRRGVNDHTLVDIARHFKGTGHIVRFIEYMDVGITNGWRLDDVLSGAEIVARISAQFPLEPISANYSGEVARRYRYADGSGEIGVITSVTAPFCSTCSRLRLSAEGQLYTCLFATDGHDIRAAIRSGQSDEELTAHLRNVWQTRGDRYSELRSERTRGLRRVEMSYIGG
jgi:cyclic pyranopterin phosphate synthase